MCADSLAGDNPKILQNLLGPSAKIDQLFGIFSKKRPHQVSIVHEMEDRSRSTKVQTFSIVEFQGEVTHKDQ